MDRCVLGTDGVTTIAVIRGQTCMRLVVGDVAGIVASRTHVHFYHYPMLRRALTSLGLTMPAHPYPWALCLAAKVLEDPVLDEATCLDHIAKSLSESPSSLTS
jgi:hypothetical protein